MQFNKNELYSINIDKLCNSFEDYKIDNNFIKPLEQYSTEYLISEYVKFNNDIKNYLNRSTEGVVDNIKKAINWLTNLIKKIIHYLEVLVKRIVAKILEWTMRSKNDIYKRFNNKVFTSLGQKIKDRRINPNLIEDSKIFMNEFRDKLTDLINNHYSVNKEFEKPFNSKRQYNTDTLNKAYTNLSNFMFNRSFDNGNVYLHKGLLDELFYVDEKAVETTVAGYFGCNPGDKPEQLEILSDQYTNLLKENKKNTTELIDKLKKLIWDLEQFRRNIGEEEPEFNDYYKISQNITLLYNLNYTFFIKSVLVRRKVAKYILKGILGDIVDQIGDGINSGKAFNVYYGIKFKQYRDMPSDQLETIKSKLYDAYIYYNKQYNAIAIDLKFKNKECEFYKELTNLYFEYSTFKAIPKFIIDEKHWNEYRKKNDHLKVFSYLSKQLPFKIDISSHSTICVFTKNIMFKAVDDHRSDFNSTIIGGYYEDPANKDALMRYASSDFHIEICPSIESHVIETGDILFHTIENNKKIPYLDGHFRNIYLFSEQRVYFGLNIPMTPDGKIGKGLKLKNPTIYKMMVNTGEIVYKDPEYATYRSTKDFDRADKTACFICKDAVAVEDITQFINDVPDVYN